MVTSLGKWIKHVTDAPQSNGTAHPLTPTSFSIPFRRYLELIQFIVLRMIIPASAGNLQSAIPADLISVRSFLFDAFEPCLLQVDGSVSTALCS